MDRDKLAQLRIKKADNKAKLHKELLDSNSSIKQAVTALHEAINNQKPINLDVLAEQIKELRESQTYGEDIHKLELALRESSDKDKLDEIITAVGNISNTDVVTAVNNLIGKIEAKTVDQSPEAYQPVRRVRKIGQRLVFDDDPLQVNVNSSGGGGSGTPYREISGKAVNVTLNYDGSVPSGGFDPSLDLTTDISTPGIIIETDGVKTLTTTITATTITEVWS